MTEEQMREAFTTWAQCHYRNAASYTKKDFDLGFAAWQAAVASQPKAEQTKLISTVISDSNGIVVTQIHLNDAQRESLCCKNVVSIPGVTQSSAIARIRRYLKRLCK